MDARTAKRFRRRLLDELGQRGRLLGQIRKSMTEQSERYIQGGGGFASHMADQATEEADLESEFQIADSQGRLVAQIEAAIQRIDEGRYGACEWCGKAIDIRRLEVVPYARYCLKCQEKQDRLQNN